MNIWSIQNFYFIIFLISFLFFYKRSQFVDLEQNFSSEYIELRESSKNNFRDTCLRNNAFIKDNCKRFIKIS